MKLKTIAELLRGFFRPGVNSTSFVGSVYKVPGGMVADNTALYGLIGGLQNVNEAIDMDLVAIVSSALTLTLTGAQFTNSIIDYSGSPGSGVTVTTPTAAQIIAAFPNTLYPDGFNYILYFINETGQTVTLSGGTNVTVSGNNTMGTNTMRQFLVNVNPGAGTVTVVNMGTQNL